MTYVEKFRPGKFEGNDSQILAEYLYTYSLEQGCDENYGFVDEGGWWGLIRNIDKYGIEAHISAENDGAAPIVHWSYILHEDTYGFFDYRGYDDIDQVNMAWEELTNGQETDRNYQIG